LAKVYIGIDNGVSGSIGVLTETGSIFLRVPEITRSEQDYTKTKRNITRVSPGQLRQFLNQFRSGADKVHVMMERPMTNANRYRATISAHRCLECFLIILESLGFSFEYIDSRQWQKDLLPNGTKGAPALKEASKDIGLRLFPEHRDKILKQGDADGLMIAEACRRFYKE